MLSASQSNKKRQDNQPPTAKEGILPAVNKAIISFVALLLIFGMSGCLSFPLGFDTPQLCCVPDGDAKRAVPDTPRSLPRGVASLTEPGAFEKSKVDVSPLNQLKGISLDDQDEILAKLRTLPFIRDAEGDNTKNTDEQSMRSPGSVWECAYSVNDLGHADGMMAVITIYATFENAASTIQSSSKENNPNKGAAKKQRTITVSPSIKAELKPAYQYRSGDAFYAYDGMRNLNTVVQIGNIIIGYFEQPSSAQRSGVLTSENLKQICDALQLQPSVLEASTIDTSILKPLASYPAYSLDELRSKLKSDNVAGSVLKYVEDKGQGTSDGKLWYYHYQISDGPSSDSNAADILLSIYDSPKDAQAALGKNKVSEITPQVTATSDNVDAMLGPVFQYHRGDDVSATVNPKFILTKIRISNMILDFSEYSNTQQAIGALTNAGLTHICKALEK